MKKPTLFLLYGGIAAFAVLWFKAVPALLNQGTPVEQLSVKPAAVEPRKVPDFSLTDQHGKSISLADLNGKVWVANFLFSSCPGPCLDLTKRVRELDKALGSREDVKLVSFSIDPTNDTPSALAEYAQKNGASSRWLFLTGERAVTAKVANEGFLLSLSSNPTDFTHSDKLVVIDQKGYACGWVDSNASDAVEQVKRIIAQLPQQNSTAAACEHCPPKSRSSLITSIASPVEQSPH